MTDDWGLMENWDESGSISELLDEIARASLRCVDEAWKETPAPKRDGTEMVLIPKGLFERLKNAVNRLREFGEY